MKTKSFRLEDEVISAIRSSRVRRTRAEGRLKPNQYLVFVELQARGRIDNALRR